MRNAENAALTTRKFEKTFQEMLNAIGVSLSDHASSDDEEDEEDAADDEDNTELRKLSEDDEPGWVMGTILNMVLLCMENVWQKQMRFDE